MHGVFCLSGFHVKGGLYYNLFTRCIHVPHCVLHNYNNKYRSRQYHPAAGGSPEEGRQKSGKGQPKSELHVY